FLTWYIANRDADEGALDLQTWAYARRDDAEPHIVWDIDHADLLLYHLVQTIFAIFVADTANTVFDVEFMYESLVNNFNNPAAIMTANWVFATGEDDNPAMTAIISTMVQLFFCWRVKVLIGRTWIVCIIVVGSIIAGHEFSAVPRSIHITRTLRFARGAQYSVLTLRAAAVGGIATAIAIGIVPHWLEFQKFKVPVIVWLTTSALVDSTITAFLVWYLRRQKTEFSASDDILNRIIRVTVQTGLVTSVWAIINLGVFLGSSSGFHLAFNFPLSKLYSNSLLSSLNARHSSRLLSESQQRRTVHVSKSAFSYGSNTPQADHIMAFNGSRVRPEVYINIESQKVWDTVKKTGELGDAHATSNPENQV
ncbi:hypothetical protein EVG20_g11538, partial [Dentipellis fragilis]